MPLIELLIEFENPCTASPDETAETATVRVPYLVYAVNGDQAKQKAAPILEACKGVVIGLQVCRL